MLKKIISSKILVLLTIGLVANSNAATDWDVDNSGKVDALTDGLLMLRYSFGIRGGDLTAGTVSVVGAVTTLLAVDCVGGW